MDPEFWLQRWREGRIGFHQSEVSAQLQRFWPALGLSSRARVLVPLCGKSRDVLWLQARCGLLTGVELSEIALEALCAENGIPARRRVLPGIEWYEAPQLRLCRGDFLSLSPAWVGPVEGIYDRAAFTSWPAERRGDYVQQLTALGASGTQLLLVTLEYPQEQLQGPPFAADPDEVERLFGRHYRIECLERADILATEPRLRARGLTRLTEACYRLERL